MGLGRSGTNQEVANVALFLASDQSSYVTGPVFFAWVADTCRLPELTGQILN